MFLWLFLCMAILMTVLASPCPNVPPEQGQPRHYFAKALSLHPGLPSTQDDYDWFKETQPNPRDFSLIAER